MMKKIILLTVIVFLLLGISLNFVQAQDKPYKGVKITIVGLRDVSMKTALELLHESDFEENTGITVRGQIMEYTQMNESQKMDFSAETGRYDIVAVDQPSLGLYVTSGWITSLDDYLHLSDINRDDIIPALLKPGGIWEDKLYAIPMGSYGNLFGYRADLFKEAGLVNADGEPLPPATFDEFFEYAKKLHNPPEVYGTATYSHKGEYLSYDAGTYLWSWGAGFINGIDAYDPSVPKYHVLWDTPKGLAALEFYVKIYNEVAPKDSLVYDHVRFTEAFQTGKVAMGILIQEAVGAPMEDPDRSKVVGKMRYAPVPGRKQPDGTISRNPHIGAHSLAINADSKNKEAAFLVLQHLTGNEIGREYILRGGKPFRFSHFFEEAFEKYPYLRSQQKNLPEGKSRPNIPEYPVVSEIFSTALHKVLSGQGDLVETMKKAAEKANKEILKPSYPEYY